MRQESLFPDLELTMSDTDAGADTAQVEPDAAAPATGETAPWRVGDDVTHRDLGHGWVQGAGHGVVTVRFETRARARARRERSPSDTDDITPANPVDSLDWPDYVAALAQTASAQAVDDVAQR